MARIDLLAELEPVVEDNLNRHLRTVKDWQPHEYVPWSKGRDFVAEPWVPQDSELTLEAQTALTMNLLTEDNLPGYHFTVAHRFGLDGAWGTWVNRWTAEESRHGQCLRDYLLTTRAVDPDMLEASRMAAVQQGYDGTKSSPLEAMAYVAFQELATRVSHRNTGRYANEPIADKLLQRIAADENLHMVFYRNLIDSTLELDPSAAVRAIHAKITDFEMPGRVIPGYAKMSMIIARAGIYHLRIHHDDVVLPLLRHWRIFDLEGLDSEAEKAREDLATFLTGLDRQAERQLDRITTQRLAAEARAH